MHNNRSSQSQGAAAAGGGGGGGNGIGVDADQAQQQSGQPASTTAAAATAVPVRRVRLTSSSQLPSNYSQTPGGTIFGTTPGGTRVIYDRDFLLSRRDCPLARAPPAGLPRIPGVTCSGDVGVVNGGVANSAEPAAATVNGDGAGGTEFEMDI